MMADAAAATTPGGGSGTTTPGQPNAFADDAEMDPYEDDNTWWDGISGWEAAAGWGVEETSGDADGGGGNGVRLTSAMYQGGCGRCGPTMNRQGLRGLDDPESVGREAL